MSDATEGEESLSSLQMLDKLINKYYETLENDNQTDIKIGDFLKMIEVRRKLAPVDADQREFWNMLEKVRKEAMNDKKKRTTRKKKPERSSDADGR